jgi:4-diphosphocytidyl-2-C-methyl-D-erythritol kinase
MGGRAVSARAFLPGVHRALAPAKINLGLFVGPVRALEGLARGGVPSGAPGAGDGRAPGAGDGRHELVTVMQSISLADELTLRVAPAGTERDEVACPGVPRENLAAAALRLFREHTAWRAPPLQLDIVKRIPVAAGLGGGSADAAAALRLAAHASGLGDGQLLLELAAQLGADVPAQVSPGRWLATGAGERLQALPAPLSSFGVLVLALDVPLSTAAVYAEGDSLQTGRSMDELGERRRALHAALEHGEALPGAVELLHNDLQRAAVSLCPQIEDALAAALAAGALHAVLSGSGPTVLGLFSTPQGAREGGARLPGRTPPPICATPVDGAFARAVTLGPGEAPPGT